MKNFERAYFHFSWAGAWSPEEILLLWQIGWSIKGPADVISGEQVSGNSGGELS